MHMHGTNKGNRRYLFTDTLALLHKTVVDHTRFDDIYQVYDGQAGLVGLDKHLVPHVMTKYP